MPRPSPAATPRKLALLMKKVRACRLCEAHLPLGPHPVLRASVTARLLIVGQAPGTKVHATGIPWNDPSGDRPRDWLGLTRDQFYDETKIAILPAGLCYPGRTKGGDAPPRPECAPLWHPRLRPLLPDLRLTLMIGRYAHLHYLDARRETLEQTVRRWREHLPRGYFPLPHPSPRNTLWLKRRPWFEAEIVPALREALAAALQDG